MMDSLQFSQPQSPKIFASDIASYSDPELDKYLEANGRIVAVKDPENLSQDFIQRLRVRAGASHAAPSPIDLHYISARLEEISSNREATPIPYSRASTPATTIAYDSEEEYPNELATETEYYDTLIREGGRPSHPVSFGRDILKNPGEYREILSYWQLVNFDAEGRVWRVFRSQMFYWRDFKKSQKAVRERAHVLKYTELAKHRLAKYGVTKPFQFHEDPERQDKLTTWIEFLNWGYRIYENRTNTVERLQSDFDEAWKKLVASEVLRPSETAESLRDLTSAIQRQNERHEAEDAVDNATLNLKQAEKVFQEAQFAGLSGRDLSQIEERLFAARSHLASLTTSRELIWKRRDFIGDFIDATKPYSIAKKNVNRQGILLRWILQQLPLIELELNTAETAKNDSNIGNDGRRGSKRNRANDLDEEQVSKRRKLHIESSSIPHCRAHASTAQRPKRQLKRNRHDSIDEKPAPKRSRYCSQNNELTHSKPSTRSDSNNSAMPILPEPRKSRRIAGQSPEFGMLPKRGEPALPHNAPLRYPLSTRKSTTLDSHNYASSKKKSVAVKNAKPKGIAKSGRAGTNRSKTPIRRSRKVNAT